MVFQLFDTQYVEDGVLYLLYVAVALLRGGAWIETNAIKGLIRFDKVALLRGGAWIETIASLITKDQGMSRTPSRGCVD